MSVARDLERLKTLEYERTYYLATPYTSTDWDGDAHSTTAKTKIDLSAVFTGTPGGIKAAYVYVTWRDSASSSSNCSIILSPNSTAGSGLAVGVEGLPDDKLQFGAVWVPCDSAGDLYYQITASGANTLDVWLQIWGFVK